MNKGIELVMMVGCPTSLIGAVFLGHLLFISFLEPLLP